MLTCYVYTALVCLQYVPGDGMRMMSGLRWKPSCRVVLPSGFLATAVAALIVVNNPGVYYSEVDVMFLAPASSRYPNTLVTTSGSIVSTAGLVESRINGPDGGAVRPASSSATILGMGQMDGYSVRLPDNGGQWAPDFNEQLLTVQAAGPDPDVVNQVRDRLVAAIRQDLADLQDEAGVATVNRISTRLSPSVPSTIYNDGDRKRALGMTLLLGAGVTGALAALVRRPRLRLLPRTLVPQPGREVSSTNRGSRPQPSHYGDGDEDWQSWEERVRVAHSHQHQ